MRAMTKSTPSAPFPSNLENKSAEPLADEAKALADTDTDAAKEDASDEPTVKVTMIHHHGDSIPGDVLDLDPRTANTLVAGRFADLG